MSSANESFLASSMKLLAAEERKPKVAESGSPNKNPVADSKTFSTSRSWPGERF